MTIKGKKRETVDVSYMVYGRSLSHVVAELTALRDDLIAVQGVNAEDAIIKADGYYGDNLALEYWRDKNEAERLADEKRSASRKARKQKKKSELEDMERREYERLVKKFGLSS